MNPISLIKSGFSFVKENVIKVLFVALIAAIAFGFLMYKTTVYQKLENSRLSENFVQANKINQVLNLKVGEYADLHTKDSKKLDSLLTVTKTKPKQLQSATIVNTEYKDTAVFLLSNAKPEKQPDSSYIIQVSTDNGCWGLKGQILTKDPDSKFRVTDRTANNSAQLIVKKPRRFLFWTIRKAEFKGYSDCGVMTFTQINFIK